MLKKTKTCGSCKQTLSISLFNFSSTNTSGIQWECKQCNNNRQNAYMAGARLLKPGPTKVWIRRVLHDIGRQKTGERKTAVPSEQRRQMQDILYKKLLDNPYCPFTGAKLIPTINTSLDHILPLSLRPDLKCDIKNMRWISKDANRARGTLTDEEFIDFCRLIAEKQTIK